MARPVPRQGHSLSIFGTGVIAFGGISYGYVPFNDVWAMGKFFEFGSPESPPPHIGKMVQVC